MEAVFTFVLEHIKIIELIVFWYPVTMGMLWVVGGVIYYYRIERKAPLPLPYTPMVSVLVPAFNESDNLIDVIARLNELDYPNYEILIINDGSSDDTARIGKALASKYERVRLIDLQENCGKANALYLGFIASKGEYLVCVDGDSYLEKDCIRYLMSHFLNENNGERVGAVTGNPRVRNRSSLFAKIQLCEYASIISLIKRTQRIWGKVMTVSGVVVAFRKQALMDCGLWDRDLITEDIGVTWKLERNFWDIRYEPNALCWMLVPETLKGLIKQRKRWAQGGQEVMFRHAGIFKSWRRRRMYPIFFEQIMSLVWVVLWLLLTVTEIFKLFYNIGSYMPYIWKSQFLSVVCMLQFVVALFLERRYDKGIFRYIIAAAWYPTIYWIVSGIVSIMALPSAIMSRRKKKLATWSSPDRGIDTSESRMEDIESIEDARESSMVAAVGIEAADSKGTATCMEAAENMETAAGMEAADDMGAIVGMAGMTSGECVGEHDDSVNDREDYREKENIIDGKQVLWKKIIEIVFTCLAWGFILIYFSYVIYGGICLMSGGRPFEFWIYNVGMLDETGRLCFITLIILLVEIVFMIFWKEYNRLKFGKLRRRTFKPDVTVEQTAQFFGKTVEEINAMREEKNITLPHNIIPKDFQAVRKELLGFELSKKDSELKV